MTNRYALGQLARALTTASTHEDPEVRARADRRAERWVDAIEQMADGRLRAGSRRPARDFPTWVTLEVLRGGFATGKALADTDLGPDEVALAERVGISADRLHILGYLLTEPGLQELSELLDSGAYQVDVPEDTALLTVAWLLRAGDRDRALELLEAVRQFADRLRLAPKRVQASALSPDLVHRSTAGDAAAALASKRPQRQVEAQREALAVWAPFGDRVLEHWLEVFASGSIPTELPAAWRSEARTLLEDYEQLAAQHTLCTKHRRPKENLAILLDGLATASRGESPTPREAGLLRTAITTSVAKRGTPGSTEHTQLRSVQRSVAAAPALSQFAAIAAQRLAHLAASEGIVDVSPYSVAVTDDEAERSGIETGSPMPAIVPRTIARARAASLEDLLDDGVIPSAEVLAEVVPQINATVIAAGFDDPSAGRLAAANYRAFRRRRSLMLFDLEKQVQLDELPWVRVLAPHGTPLAELAMTTAQRVSGLALDHFPATLVPNRLVDELEELVLAAGREVPLIEELAADIFAGRFSDKFRLAAQAAVGLVGDKLYGRYYEIDAPRVLALVPDPADPSTGWWRHRATPPRAKGETFDQLCQARAGRTPMPYRDPAVNGTIIEQAQILTTHNLASLVSLGAHPSRSWVDLARESIGRTAELLELVPRQERPLGTVKNAAYAWRQAIFYLSLADPAAAEELLADDAVEVGPPVMSELVTGLRHTARGGRPREVGRGPFLGWTVGPHWVLTSG